MLKEFTKRSTANKMAAFWKVTGLCMVHVSLYYETFFAVDGYSYESVGMSSPCKRSVLRFDLVRVRAGSPKPKGLVVSIYKNTSVDNTVVPLLINATDSTYQNKCNLFLF